MANFNSKNAARKKVREAQARANEARLERERLNVDDAASFLVELGRLAAVDEWEQGRVAEIRAEGERRRHEHRQEVAAAVARMVDRGESLTGIAELAGVKVSEVRAVLKSAGAQPVAPPDALGAPSAVSDAGSGAAPSARADEAAGTALGDAARRAGVGGAA
jgi:predicted HTH domain antitoxin